MGFIIVLILTTLAIAGSAALFSVVGLAHVFSGAFLSVVIMGSSLEAGKLVAASFLYRYWDKITKSMRTYLFAAVVSLMGITSMGIFGYLSTAFQDNILPYQQHQQQITLVQDEINQLEKLKAERLARSQQINEQIANLPNDYVSGRQRLINANKDELNQIRKDVAGYTEQIRADTTKLSDLKNEVLQQTAHVGPIIFIAEAFGADVTQATKWLIILIIFVFDPLAVVLTVGTNIALADRQRLKQEKTPIVEPELVIEPTPEPELLVEQPEAVEPAIEAEVVAPVVEQPIPPEPKPDTFSIDPNRSAFLSAHEMFNKPNLSHEEQNAKRALESTINNYTTSLRTRR